MDFFGFLQKLSEGDNPVVSLLSVTVMSLCGVVVYQWNYTLKKTVPKWIWDSLSVKIEGILDSQSKISTIIDERLKK